MQQDAASKEQNGEKKSGPRSKRFLDRWAERAEKARGEQPHWMTPVAVTTPRLEQEFRYDIAWQQASNGVRVENYGFSKGLELIPAEKMEIIVSPPPYLARNQSNKPDGLGDLSFLLKYRLLSRDEENGSYILTFFLGTTVPTGKSGIGQPNPVITPTVAMGKGWGQFDIQSTLGAALPTGHIQTLGRSVLWNTAFQYHLKEVLWPEVEVNSTFFIDGPDTGKKQSIVTPGIVFGRFSIYRQLHFAVGLGYQIATTQFHTNNHNWILTLRFPF
ncbi:MAG: hypothetical protein PHX83_00100 [Acidobacteriia bacterium]|nr:hypothetical protein [Terriglobia bacterium]